jgi:hypothetical protein
MYLRMGRRCGAWHLLPVLGKGALRSQLLTDYSMPVNFKYRLPDAWTAKTLAMEEFANGGMQVTIRLNDGRVMPRVLLSMAAHPIAMRGYKDLPFLIEDIADIYQSDEDRNPPQRGGWEFWDDWR